MKVLIVGVGLIGGSFALGINHKERKYQVGGCDMDEESLEKAFRLRIIDQVFALHEGVRWADMILLAVPVGAIKKLAIEVLNAITPDKVVVDFGSTKQSIAETISGHPNRASYIAAHPIAGTEYSGPEAAFPELFHDANLIICDAEHTQADKLTLFERIAEEAGFNILHMNAAEHDRHLAYISHLSHITSFALSNTVLKKEKNGEVILEMAGSGFASTVRLAKSSPDMWSSIFIENKTLLLESLQYYIEDLNELKGLLEADDLEAIYKYLEKGREIRKILK